jgi:hypothetical protein
MGIHNAYAYLDPGSGSLIIQSTIAAIAGFFYVIKTYFGALKNKFFPKKNNDCAKQDESK